MTTCRLGSSPRDRVSTPSMSATASWTIFRSRASIGSRACSSPVSRACSAAAWAISARCAARRFAVVLHIDQDPDPLVQARARPPDGRAPGSRPGSGPPCRPARTCPLIAVEDVHVIPAVDVRRLGDGIDAHVDEHLLDEVGDSVGLLLEIGLVVPALAHLGHRFFLSWFPGGAPLRGFALPPFASPR